MAADMVVAIVFYCCCSLVAEYFALNGGDKGRALLPIWAVDSLRFASASPRHTTLFATQAGWGAEHPRHRDRSGT